MVAVTTGRRGALAPHGAATSRVGRSRRRRAPLWSNVRPIEKGIRRSVGGAVLARGSREHGSGGASYGTRSQVDLLGSGLRDARARDRVSGFSESAAPT